jgi:hypothetical protein
MDLDQIRHKLDLQARKLPQQGGAPPVDWPKTHLPPRAKPNGTIGAGPGDSANLFTTLEALKQRRMAYPGMASPAAQAAGGAPDGADLEEKALQEVQIHVQRLKSLADKVNLLSSEQEHLMSEIRSVQGRLELLQPYVGGAPDADPMFPKIDLEGAVLASAESDRAANLVMTYRVANIPQPHQEAHDLASHLRGAYSGEPGAHTFSWSALVTDFGAVWQEPAALVGLLWARLCHLGQRANRRVAVASSRGRRPRQVQSSIFESLSLMDMIFWFGGGFIGRLALNLTLSAWPALWSVAVAVLTGVTAYSLYRATLAPRRDFGLVYRVFLTILGLILGGRI